MRGLAAVGSPKPIVQGILTSFPVYNYNLNIKKTVINQLRQRWQKSPQSVCGRTQRARLCLKTHRGRWCGGIGCFCSKSSHLIACHRCGCFVPTASLLSDSLGSSVALLQLSCIDQTLGPSLVNPHTSKRPDATRPSQPPPIARHPVLGLVMFAERWNRPAFDAGSFLSPISFRCIWMRSDVWWCFFLVWTGEGLGKQNFKDLI